MIFIEEKGDLFELKDTHLLVHCISRDCAMLRGIAATFRELYPEMPERTFIYLNNLNYDRKCVIYQGKIANLITKNRYYEKPTYESLRESLLELKSIILNREIPINKIAMPRIGSGLDKLKWTKVKNIIKEVFYDTNIEIVVRVI